MPSGRASEVVKQRATTRGHDMGIKRESSLHRLDHLPTKNSIFSQLYLSGSSKPGTLLQSHNVSVENYNVACYLQTGLNMSESTGGLKGKWSHESKRLKDAYLGKKQSKSALCL